MWRRTGRRGPAPGWRTQIPALACPSCILGRLRLVGNAQGKIKLGKIKHYDVSVRHKGEKKKKKAVVERKEGANSDREREGDRVT